MPYVNIRITREGASAAQKADLIAGVTTLLHDVLGKNPATTFVIIDEVDTDNWGIGGEPVDSVLIPFRAVATTATVVDIWHRRSGGRYAVTVTFRRHAALWRAISYWPSP